MSNAIAAINTYLKQGNGGTPETFTTVAEVRSLTGPGLAQTIQDVTNHSAVNPWKDKLPTLIDAGDLSFELNFIPTDATQDNASGMLKDFANRTKRNYKLVFPDGAATTRDFSGYVSSFGIQAPVDGVLRASAKITITGQPTFRG